MLNVIQTGYYCLNNLFCLIGSSNRDGNNTCFFNWIVISSNEDCITDKYHLFQSESKDIPQLSDAVGFVNAWFGDINGCRTAHSNGKLRYIRVKDRFNLLPLCEIRIPFFLFFQRRLLTQCGKCYLATPVFNDYTPGFFDLEPRYAKRRIERNFDFFFFICRKVFRIDFFPILFILVELCSARRKEG